MNVQTQFRFKLSEKTCLQDSEVGKTTAEYVKSRAPDSQLHSMDKGQMSSQRTLSAHVQQQQHQQQQYENEHMGTLHARLHQEADKIRKWKIQTELDLKDKVKKLTEANLQIDVMKKSLLELQLENERTSAKLLEEIGNREEVIQRINGTRKMCSLLQTHAANMDERLIKCETEKTELKYVGKENMKLVEEVTKQFKNLQKATAESKKKIQSQTSIERSDRIQMEKVMRAKMDETECEAQKLMDALKHKEKELDELLITLQDKDKKIEIVEITKDDLQNKVTDLCQELVTKERELRESALRISAIQDDKCKLEKMMKGLEQEFNLLQITKDSITMDMTETTMNLQEQLQKAKQDAETMKNLLEEEQCKLKTCKNNLAETSALVDTLKNEKDSLMMEKTDVEMQLDLLKFQISNLMMEKAEDKDEISKLNGEIVILTKKLDKESLCRLHAQDDIETLQARNTTLLLERDAHAKEIVIFKSLLSSEQEKMKSLESLLSEEEHKSIKLQNNLDKMEEKSAADREHLQQAEEQIDELRLEVSKKHDDITLKNEIIEKLNSDLQVVKLANLEKETELKAIISELENLRAKISEQDKRIRDLTCQLLEFDDQKKETERSLTSQQKEVATTAKQKQDLEKEIKSIQAVLEEERHKTKECEDELCSVYGELETLKTINDGLRKSHSQCEEDMRRVKEMCQQEQEAARLAVKKAEEMQNCAEREQQNAVARTDRHLAEMMATLDIYKQNNEKLLLEKDTEIQALRVRSEHAESLAAKRDRELTECKKEIENLKHEMYSKITVKNHEIPAATAIVSVSRKQSPRTAPVTPIKTPQSSILRSCSSVSISKRRKVAFISNDGSQTSSSDELNLLELNIAPDTLTEKKVVPGKLCKDETYPNNVEPKTKVTSDGKTSNIRKTPAKKMSKMFTTSPRRKLQSSKTKIKEKTRPDTSSHMSWFEMDSVYGFGPED